MMLGFSLVTARADETVRTAQTRLRTDGFYHGAVTGSYDDETAAAVTRYQIRHGLEISGKLDAATAKSLGIAAPPKKDATVEPSAASETWRRLRDGDRQFLKGVNAGAIPPPQPPAVTAGISAPETSEPAIDPHAPPPRLAEDVPGAAASAGQADEERFGTERLRDYVAAFVLAGLDPAAGAELEFFADRVNYFGEEGVGRERIRRDLIRYDREWPQRRFWLDGEMMSERLPGGNLKVVFPLRYELRNGSRQVSGKVMKTLVLQRTTTGELEITGVNERKL